MYMYNDSRKTFATRDVGSPNFQPSTIYEHLAPRATPRREMSSSRHIALTAFGGVLAVRVDRVSIASRSRDAFLFGLVTHDNSFWIFRFDRPRARSTARAL